MGLSPLDEQGKQWGPHFDEAKTAFGQGPPPKVRPGSGVLRSVLGLERGDKVTLLAEGRGIKLRVTTYENWERVVRHDNGGITAVEITDSAGVPFDFPQLQMPTDCPPVGWDLARGVLIHLKNFERGVGPRSEFYMRLLTEFFSCPHVGTDAACSLYSQKAGDRPPPAHVNHLEYHHGEVFVHLSRIHGEPHPAVS
jgi:hypothetical protein